MDSGGSIGAILTGGVESVNLGALLGPDLVSGRASLSLWELAGRWEVVIKQIFGPWWVLQIKEVACSEGASLVL